ncbi:MAG: 2-methylaconitate cis-trans isomerase PrpF [Rhodocyclaceae bacterium]|nr:2-methylaconitate cis-trans isomerase PrpF [Rhodocyclaceae bacterium]
MPTLEIPAAWMRGGTSKGLFFTSDVLPALPAERDAILLRAMGSPDPYGKQIDGLGGATSSTSKVVIIGPSARADCDVDYLFGQVPVSGGPIDWSGNCGNLTAAVGPFAIRAGFVVAPREGSTTVRIWQANIARRIDAHVTLRDGEVVEDGRFRLDGVCFPGAPVRLDFIDPAGAPGPDLFPTGRLQDLLEVDGQRFAATLINAGNPLVLVRAADLDVDCAASAATLSARGDLLARCEALRAAGSVALGLAPDTDTARLRGHTPKLALLDHPQAFTAADGRAFAADDTDLACRVLSMGVFHHAIPGTAAVALASAAALAGTLAAALVRPHAGAVRLAHPSGLTSVEARIQGSGATARVRCVTMTRSARLLMSGHVRVPTGH